MIDLPDWFGPWALVATIFAIGWGLLLRWLGV